ncbi:hypothetical protein [Prevotella sp. KH2C16]|uniref:hypothetical protein n=1 Tax=Prevotella sp. KH2C16 TaxID=1855325 RepID=UPI0008F2243F|nr:hypothetical protein [Prevotella sp. KH2C16]SFG15178.1 hypothetical protein SAMN05216383_1066 [Prevotella sp. KH2C16]
MTYFLLLLFFLELSQLPFVIARNTSATVSGASEALVFPPPAGTPSKQCLRICPAGECNQRAR